MRDCSGALPLPALLASHAAASLKRRSQEESAAHIASLNAERDDLKALLVATLKRLEAVDEMVQRADISSSVMQEKVRRGGATPCACMLQWSGKEGHVQHGLCMLACLCR